MDGSISWLTPMISGSRSRCPSLRIRRSQKVIKKTWTRNKRSLRTEGHGFSRAVLSCEDEQFRACEKSIPKLSPAGTAELSPGRESWGELKGRSSPVGTAGNRPRRILDNLQPSLRDSTMFHDVPRTSVLG